MKQNKKTLYIKDELTKQIENLSNKHNISFNQAVTLILSNYFEEKNKDQSK